MPARALGALAITTALVLLPTAVHAADPPTGARSVTTAADPAAQRTVDTGLVVGGPSDPASTGLADAAVLLGLVVLVGGALVLVLTGRRPDDDEPAG